METTLGGSVLAYADAVQVRYQGTDFATATSNSSMRLLSSASPSAGVQSLSSASPSRPSDSARDTSTSAADTRQAGGSDGLSPGAYAGVGVAVAAALVLAVVAILWTVRRRRRKGFNVKDTDNADGNMGEGNSMPEMDVSSPSSEMAVTSPVSEMGQREAGEMRGDIIMPAELGTIARIHQLE